MKLIVKLMLIGSLLLSCAAGYSIYSPSQTLDDVRFTRADSLLGRMGTEVEFAIGQPRQKDQAGCEIGISFNGRTAPLTGNAWHYEYEVEGVRGVRHLCLVEGVVVAEKLILMLNQEGKILIYTSEGMDSDLAKNLFLGKIKPKDSNKLDRGRKIEI